MVFTTATTQFYKVQFVLIIQLGMDKKEKQDIVKAGRETRERKPNKETQFLKEVERQEILIKRRSQERENFRKAGRDEFLRL